MCADLKVERRVIIYTVSRALFRSLHDPRRFERLTVWRKGHIKGRVLWREWWWVEHGVPSRNKSTRGQDFPSVPTHKSSPTNGKRERSEGKHSIYMQMRLISLSITSVLIPGSDGAGCWVLAAGGLNGGHMSSDRWARGGMRLFVCCTGHRYRHSFTRASLAPKLLTAPRWDNYLEARRQQMATQIKPENPMKPEM